MEDDPTPKRNNQILRATSLVYSSLKFVSTLKQGRMQPDMVKTTPLCMSQYKRMFGTARIAEEKQDSIKVDAKSGHIVVNISLIPYQSFHPVPQLIQLHTDYNSVSPIFE